MGREKRKSKISSSKNIAKEVGSGGGGPKHFGTAEFNDIVKYNKAIDSLKKYIKESNIEK